MVILRRDYETKEIEIPGFRKILNNPKHPDHKTLKNYTKNGWIPVDHEDEERELEKAKKKKQKAKENRERRPSYKVMEEKLTDLINENKLDKKELDNFKAVRDIKNNYNDKSRFPNLNLEFETKCDTVSAFIHHNDYSEEKKIKMLKDANEIARNYSNLVSQVRVSLIEYDKEFTVANTFNKLINSNYSHTRIIVDVTVVENGNKESSFNRIGSAGGYESFENINLEKLVKDTIDEAIDLLHASNFEGGEYPVIISKGFGAVIFHEACGHGLEATSVAPKTSCFTGLLGQKIASEKVTLIDDGTMKNIWGSINVDDEGNLPKKNILIDKGVLKSYLVDYSNIEKMDNHPLTGSGRREDYTYEPTSRMTNTYLASGTDAIEDMIKSIDYGIYCYSLGGGLVDPASGNFNFNV